MTIIEQSRHLKEILINNLLTTSAEVASTWGQTTLWVERMLSLNKIIDSGIHRAINDGTIGINSAFELATLPELFHTEYAMKALDMSTFEFMAAVQQFKKSRGHVRKPSPIQEYLAL